MLKASIGADASCVGPYFRLKSDVVKRARSLSGARAKSSSICGSPGKISFKNATRGVSGGYAATRRP
jgi:hypothetical protein